MKLKNPFIQLFIILLSLLSFTQISYAQTSKIALVTTADARPFVKKINEVFKLGLESFYPHNLVEKHFRSLLKKTSNATDSITLETHHFVSFGTLYTLMQRSDLDAIFIFGHMGALNEDTKVFPNHTGKLDLQTAFTGLKGQSKFIGLCGCNSAYFLNDIRKISPQSVAYGIQHKIKGALHLGLNSLFHAWHKPNFDPEIHDIIQECGAKATPETYDISLTLTRYFNDPSVDFYDELGILDTKNNCIGYFDEQKPNAEPQTISVTLSLPKKALCSEKKTLAYPRYANITCNSFYRFSKMLGQRKPVFGTIHIDSCHEALQGTWEINPSSGYMTLEYNPEPISLNN